MLSFPKSITTHEKGPREAFQIERRLMPTVRKIELVEALSERATQAPAWGI